MSMLMYNLDTMSIDLYLVMQCICVLENIPNNMNVPVSIYTLSH